MREGVRSSHNISHFFVTMLTTVAILYLTCFLEGCILSQNINFLKSETMGVLFTALSPHPPSITVPSTRRGLLNICWVNAHTHVVHMHAAPFLTHWFWVEKLLCSYCIVCVIILLILILACLFLSSVLLHFIFKRQERSLWWNCNWQLQPHQCSQNTPCHVAFPLFIETTKSFGGQVLNSDS